MPARELLCTTVRRRERGCRLRVLGWYLGRPGKLQPEVLWQLHVCRGHVLPVGEHFAAFMYAMCGRIQMRWRRQRPCAMPTRNLQWYRGGLGMRRMCAAVRKLVPAGVNLKLGVKLCGSPGQFLRGRDRVPVQPGVLWVGCQSNVQRRMHRLTRLILSKRHADIFWRAVSLGRILLHRWNCSAASCCHSERANTCLARKLGIQRPALPAWALLLEFSRLPAWAGSDNFFSSLRHGRVRQYRWCHFVLLRWAVHVCRGLVLRCRKHQRWRLAVSDGVLLRRALGTSCGLCARGLLPPRHIRSIALPRWERLYRRRIKHAVHWRPWTLLPTRQWRYRGSVVSGQLQLCRGRRATRVVRVCGGPLLSPQWRCGGMRCVHGWVILSRRHCAGCSVRAGHVWVARSEHSGLLGAVHVLCGVRMRLGELLNWRYAVSRRQLVCRWCLAAGAVYSEPRLDVPSGERQRGSCSLLPEWFVLHGRQLDFRALCCGDVWGWRVCHRVVHRPVHLCSRKLLSCLEYDGCWRRVCNRGILPRWCLTGDRMSPRHVRGGAGDGDCTVQRRVYCGAG